MDIQKTVLVVDDSTTNRSILCDILHSDYTVIQAENGIQALTKLKRQDKKVDAIILDIIMPEMDGYEFMNKIKQDKTYVDRRSMCGGTVRGSWSRSVFIRQQN